MVPASCPSAARRSWEVRSRRAATSSSFSSSRSRFFFVSSAVASSIFFVSSALNPRICASMRLNPRARYASSSPPSRGPGACTSSSPPSTARIVSCRAETRRMRIRPSRIQNATTRKTDAPIATCSKALRSAATRCSASASDASSTRRALAPRASLNGATSRSTRPESGSSITSPASRVAGPRQRVKTMPPASMRAAVKSASIPRAACRATSARRIPRWVRTVAASSSEI